MKVALVYDRVNKWGGAERVLLSLHEIFPQAPLYTSVYNPMKTPWANVFVLKTSFLQKFPYASSVHELLPVFMPLAFESFSFDQYDLVISVTSEAAKGIITKPGTLHICYCLTPTRYLWSGYEEYFKNPVNRFFTQPAVSYLRKWDYIAAQRPDAYIAISKEVQKRIKKYYGRESEVVYPPVDLPSVKYQVSSIKGKEAGFFLVVSRLVPYKRIDIAIKACNRLQLPLKIIGTGSEEGRLKSIAGQTIEFLGNLTDSELVGYYKACRALIFPGLEDFGVVVAEAQKFGRPVIAFYGGGAREIVKEQKTGLFFYPQTTEALVSTLIMFEKKRFSSAICADNAERFSLALFKKTFMSLIEKLKDHV
ncbi:MAG: glycosyltransferase [Candidatus Levybacteria bacterium]|nr:glycosyltransferase [Candidatus Levybacteria bacterium]